MFSIEEFIIAFFCCVDDLLEEITQGHPIRAKGFAPALCDSEVMTMEIVAEGTGLLMKDETHKSPADKHFGA